MKEKTIYETSDGKEFKSKSGAINHERKLIVNNLVNVLNMSSDEIQTKLEEISKRNNHIKMLFTINSDWTKWEKHQLNLLTPNLFKEPLKETLYVQKIKSWGKEKEEELFKETGESFADPELHCDDEFKVVEVVDVHNALKKVYYDFKYSWEERMLRKLKKAEELTEKEIRSLVLELNVVYEEEGEDRRWSRSMLSVVDLNGELYAIEWENGLTENQENEYDTQPYAVELKTEERIVKTTVTTIIKK